MDNKDQQPNSGLTWIVESSGVEPLPIGSYFAEFIDVQPFNNQDKNILNKLRWTWKVVSGPHANKIASAITDQKFTTANNAGKLITGMAGRSIANGEIIKELVESFKGKKFLVHQTNGPKGGKPSIQTPVNAHLKLVLPHIWCRVPSSPGNRRPARLSRHRSLPQQVQSRATVHLPFEHF